MECTCRKVVLAAGIVGAVAYLGYNRLRNATENETETEATMDSIVQNDKETQCNDMNDGDTQTVRWPAPVGDTDGPVYSPLGHIEDGEESRAALRRSSLQKFLCDEVEQGELCIARNDLVEGVEHLANAVLVCSDPHTLMESLKVDTIFFYRQLDFPSEPGVANDILGNEAKSCLTVA